MVRPNAVVSNTVFDAAGRVTGITHTGPGGVIDSYSYGYDGVGNRTSFTSNAGTETYQLDALYRLTGFTATDGTVTSFTYDPAGNRLSATDPSGTVSYGYDSAGRLVDVDGTTVLYDAAGNVTDDGTSSFGWDEWGRLTSITTGSDTVTYGYDSDGLLTEVSAGGGTTEGWLWDTTSGLPTVIGIDDTAFLHTDGRVVSETTTGGATLQLLADGLGSIRAVTDATGTVTGTTGYDVVGEATTTGFGSVFGFTGEPTTATGEVYLRARMYDPGTGRFLSRDTVQPNAPGTQGFNPYTYVANNPTTWTDPTGHVADTSLQAPSDATTANLAWGLLQFIRVFGVVGTVCLVAFHLGWPCGVVAVALVGLAVTAVLLGCFVAGPCRSDVEGHGTPTTDPGTTGRTDTSAVPLEPDPTEGLLPEPGGSGRGGEGGSDAAPPAECEPPGGDVYRSLRADEDPSQGLAAKNPAAQYSVEGHVLNNSRPSYASQFISSTWQESIARSAFGGDLPGNRVVRIDLAQVDGRVLDLFDDECREALLKGVTARNRAIAHQEVLIEGYVPPSAMEVLP